MLLKGFFAVQRQFVLHHQAGERQPGFTAVTLQVGGVFVWVRNGNRRLGSLAEVLLINDKAAADRVIRLAVEHLVAGGAVMRMPFSCSDRLSAWKFMH